MEKLAGYRETVIVGATQLPAPSDKPDVAFTNEEADEDAKEAPEESLNVPLNMGDEGLEPNAHEGDLNEGDTIAAEGAGKIGEDIIEDDMEEGLAGTSPASPPRGLYVFRGSSG